MKAYLAPLRAWPATRGDPAPSGEQTGGKPGWAGIVARYTPAAIATATMAWFGLWDLARGSAMGNDEVVSRFAALLPLPRLFHLLRQIDAVHGLYYLLLHFWMAVGTSPAVMRIPSVIAMALAAGLLAILGQRLTGSGWAGLFAGLIMATTPYISYYAQTARSYALVYACVVGATLALVNALQAEKAAAADSRRSRWWFAYGALVTLAAYLNEMALLMLAAHAVTVLLARYGYRSVKRWFATALISFVIVIPLLILSGLQHGEISWIKRVDFQEVTLLYHDYFAKPSKVALLLVVCAVAAILPEGAWWRRVAHIAGRHAGGQPTGVQQANDGGISAGRAGGQQTDAQQADDRQVRAWWAGGGVSIPSVSLPLLILPAGLLLAESWVVRPMYQDRYVLYGEAGVALLAGAGACRIGRWLAAAVRRREVAVIPGIAVVACTLLLQLGNQRATRSPDSREYNFGAAAFYVAEHAHRGNGVLFFDSFFRKAELGYPAQFRDTRDFAQAVSPAIAAPYQGINKPVAVIDRLMLGYHRIFVVGSVPSGRMPAPWRQESRQLHRYFTDVASRRFRGMWVTVWVRKGPR
jgi:mannosyltransferase